MITAAPAALARARDLIDPALRRAVAGLARELREPAEYHFEASGKGVRPALAMLSAESVGAPAEVAVPGAVAIELVHNFSLIHDDIIDGDRERRHRETVWSRYGVDRAIVVGDAVHTLAFRVLLDEATPERMRATQELATATEAMLIGESRDMAFNTCDHVDLDRCLAMERDKTGALLGYAASVGAILAGAPEQRVAPLREFGVNLGIAFQAVDDLLGIWGDPERTGKPVSSDIRERKKSVPVTIALETSAELRALYTADDIDIARARALIEATGARQQTEELARRHLDLALESVDHAELEELARFVVEREF